jgi:hypothetical protein
MERRTQSSRISNANKCDWCVLKSEELAVNRCILYLENQKPHYEKWKTCDENRVVFDLCSR